MICRITSALAVGFALAACATNSNHQDPLQNTKKLVKEGHRDLYENGAFQVPSTEIKLIPPGPDAIGLAGELVGLKARQSFLLSLKNAQTAVYVVSNGTKFSYRLGRDIYGTSDDFATAVTQFSRPQSKILILKSAGDAYGIVGESFEFSKSVKSDLRKFSTDLEEYAGKSFSAIREETDRNASMISEGGEQTAKDFHQSSVQRTGENLSKAREDFVTGYIELPEAWHRYRKETATSENFVEMNKKFSENSKWKNDQSDKMQSLVKSSGRDYFSNIGNSLSLAKSDFSGTVENEGVSFATLKAGRWVVQALFYDAIIAPISKAAYGSLGYIFVNGIAYPVLLAKDGGSAMATTAVQFTWDSLRMVGLIVAPTLEAAFAGVISGGDIIGSELAAGTIYAGSKTLSTTVKVGGNLAAVAVTGASYTASKGVYYIGVPLTMVGVTSGGAAVGAVYGVGEAVTGSAIAIGGEATQITARTLGATAAGTTTAVGTVGSATASGVLALYEMSKAVVVPSGYALGSGIVLGYWTSTHLAAQSLLAVSDAAYLVLSLEGPRWVVYAVRGKTGSGEDLSAGTVVDLKKMRKEGEEFESVPASDSEIKNVIDALPADLQPDVSRKR